MRRSSTSPTARRPCAWSARAPRRRRPSRRSCPGSSCRSPGAASPCRRARAARRSPPIRGSGCRAPVGGDPERVGALDLHHVGEQVELVGDIGVPRQGVAMRAMIGAVPRVTRLPPHVQRAREPRARCCTRSARCSRPTGAVLVIDDSSPDGTGELADRLAGEIANVSRPAPRAQGGPRPCVHRRLPPRARRRRRARARDGLRLLPRPARTCRACSPPRENADLVLGSRYVEGGGVRNWGRLRRIISAGGSTYARIILGTRVRDLTGGFKCIRRAVLETIAARPDRLQGLCLPDRDHLPRRARRLPRRRGADRLRRPRGGPLEDEPGDRARGGLARAAAATEGALRAALAPGTIPR